MTHDLTMADDFAPVESPVATAVAGVPRRGATMIEPVILGGGNRLFPDDGNARPLELVSTALSKTAVHICTYRPAR